MLYQTSIEMSTQMKCNALLMSYYSAWYCTSAQWKGICKHLKPKDCFFLCLICLPFETLYLLEAFFHFEHVLGSSYVVWRIKTTTKKQTTIPKNLESVFVCYSRKKHKHTHTRVVLIFKVSNCHALNPSNCSFI